ncbi:hypothetical protein DDE82_006018 [Stemphylium lycopersici]|nr:hypothetical protein DDE82_006018 [Stemphylium lycopersici]
MNLREEEVSEKLEMAMNIEPTRLPKKRKHEETLLATEPRECQPGPSKRALPDSLLSAAIDAPLLIKSHRDLLRLTTAPDMGYSAARAAILRPFRTDFLPEPCPDEPLFFSAEEQRHWYFGYIHRWENFQSSVINYWNEQETKDAFEQIKGFQVGEPRPADPMIAGNSQGSAILEDHFRREVLEIVKRIYNTLLSAGMAGEADRGDTLEGIWLENAAKTERYVKAGFKPSFLVRATSDGAEMTRLVGHTEYLGGRPGALTLAIKQAAKNTLGSLRDVARWMFQCNRTYGFVISSDEIIFIHFDIHMRTEKVNVAPSGQKPKFEIVDITPEPNLRYSDPIKFTDVLNEEMGTVSVKLALMHMIHSTMTKEWTMPENKGKCGKFFPKGNASENFRLKPPKGFSDFGL